MRGGRCGGRNDVGGRLATRVLRVAGARTRGLLGSCLATAARRRLTSFPPLQRPPLVLLFILACAIAALTAHATVPTPVPPDQRGTSDAERSGFHDANNIRTVFWNFGMVGDYPQNPGDVDLSVFHSVEAPKGSGMNYGDGITPFVLTPVTQRDGSTVRETASRAGGRTWSRSHATSAS